VKSMASAKRIDSSPSPFSQPGRKVRIKFQSKGSQNATPGGLSYLRVGRPPRAVI